MTVLGIFLIFAIGVIVGILLMAVTIGRTVRKKLALLARAGVLVRMDMPSELSPEIRQPWRNAEAEFRRQAEIEHSIGSGIMEMGIDVGEAESGAHDPHVGEHLQQ